MKKLFPLFLCIITSVHISAQIITNPERLADIEKMLHTQQEMLGNRSEVVFGFLHDSLSVNEMQAMKFLYAYMPLSDLADYDNEFFLRNIQVTLRMLDEIPWVRTVPEDEFLHFVLPIRVNNENLDSFRIKLYEELRDRVNGLTMYDAALEVNHWCHEKVTYRSSDERTSSPLNTMKYSFGRCGEESVFTVAALRTVGIPARQVYTPRWAHSDDNHAWVEVWIDGKWYFLGACEPEPELNMGWFAFPASRAVLVHTRAYGKYFGTEEVITAEDRFSELNLITNYADTKNLTIKVCDSMDIAYPNVSVGVLLYNYAELYPIASKFTAPDGTTSITLGLGEIIIWVTDGDFFNYKYVQVAKTDTVHIQLGTQHSFPEIKQYHFTPPLGTFIEPYSGEKSEITRKRLMYEDSLRGEYMTTFKDSLQSATIAQNAGFRPEEAGYFIKNSYGNYSDIIGFLEITPEKYKQQAILLLSVISEKDLRDANAHVLNDHLLTTAEVESEWYENNINFYRDYILNPRIANELLTPWRSYLRSRMEIELGVSDVTPIQLEIWVKSNIKVNSTANMHSRAPISPEGVYRLGVADPLSRDIFFVALCRTFGIPSRLHPETKIPQYFFANQWNNVWFETKEVNPETANLFFTNPLKSTTDKYYNTFTLARIIHGTMKTLEYDWSKPLNELEGISQEIFAGDYVLVKGIRLSEGTVLSEIIFFQVKADEKVEVNANAPQLQVTKQNYGKLKLKHFLLEEFGTGNTEILEKTTKGKAVLLVCIDPDKEPSKHVMHDLALVKTQLEESGIVIYFILSPQILSPSFHPSMFKGMPKQGNFLLDTNNSLLLKLISYSKNPELPLVCLLSEQKKILFLSNGYRIGTGDEILRLLK